MSQVLELSDYTVYIETYLCVNVFRIPSTIDHDDQQGICHENTDGQQQDDDCLGNVSGAHFGKEVGVNVPRMGAATVVEGRRHMNRRLLAHHSSHRYHTRGDIRDAVKVILTHISRSSCAKHVHFLPRRLVLPFLTRFVAFEFRDYPVELHTMDPVFRTHRGLIIRCSCKKSSVATVCSCSPT